MPDPTLLVFALAALVTAATPGPTVILAMTNGSRHGLRLALAGMLGAVLSDLLLMAAVALGLGSLLAASEFGFSIVKWVGVGYLAYLGLNLLRARRTDLDRAPRGAASAASARSLFAKSLLVALSNPKGLLFFSALLPQFIEPAAPQVPQYLALAAVFASIDLLVMLGYALLGARAIRRLGHTGICWIDRLCGGTLLLLAGALATYRRTGP